MKKVTVHYFSKNKDMQFLNYLAIVYVTFLFQTQLKFTYVCNFKRPGNILYFFE